MGRRAERLLPSRPALPAGLTPRDELSVPPPGPTARPPLHSGRRAPRPCDGIGSCQSCRSSCRSGSVGCAPDPADALGSPGRVLSPSACSYGQAALWKARPVGHWAAVRPVWVPQGWVHSENRGAARAREGGHLLLRAVQWSDPAPLCGHRLWGRGWGSLCPGPVCADVSGLTDPSTAQTTHSPGSCPSQEGPPHQVLLGSTGMCPPNCLQVRTAQVPLLLRDGAGAPEVSFP